METPPALFNREFPYPANFRNKYILIKTHEAEKDCNPLVKKWKNPIGGGWKDASTSLMLSPLSLPKGCIIRV